MSPPGAQGAQISLGERLRALIDQRFASHKEFARAAGCSAPTLSRLLSGQRPFAREHVEAFARALGLPPAELVAGTDAEALLRPMGAFVPREELERVERELASTRAQLDEAKALLEALTQADFQALRGDLAGVRQRYLYLENHHDWAKARILTLEGQLAERREQQMESEAQVQGLQRENKKLRQSLSRAHLLVRTNYDAWRQANAQLNDAIEQNERLKQRPEPSAAQHPWGAAQASAVLVGLVGLGLGVTSMK